MAEMPKRYVNQKEEINHGTDACGAATVAMIMDHDPMTVSAAVGHSTPDNVLIDYIKKHGGEARVICAGGTPESRWFFKPTVADFEAMRASLDSGEVILYHFAGWDKKSSGHYAVCWDYVPEGSAFVFNDPAGNRNGKYFGKGYSGEGVVYSEKSLIAAGIARLWGIKINKEEN